jgi:hypothetical protein
VYLEGTLCFIFFNIPLRKEQIYFLEHSHYARVGSSTSPCPEPYFGMTFSSPQFKELNHKIGDIINKKIEEKYFKMELFWDFQWID